MKVNLKMTIKHIFLVKYKSLVQKSKNKEYRAQLFALEKTGCKLINISKFAYFSWNQHRMDKPSHVSIILRTNQAKIYIEKIALDIESQS